MQTRVRKWGNSLAVRIPKVFALEIDLAQDMLVELSLEEGRLMIAPVPPATPTLEELLQRITPENLHDEVDTGPVVGNEVW